MIQSIALFITYLLGSSIEIGLLHLCAELGLLISCINRGSIHLCFEIGLHTSIVIDQLVKCSL